MVSNDYVDRTPYTECAHRQPKGLPPQGLSVTPSERQLTAFLFNAHQRATGVQSDELGAGRLPLVPCESVRLSHSPGRQWKASKTSQTSPNLFRSFSFDSSSTVSASRHCSTPETLMYQRLASLVLTTSPNSVKPSRIRQPPYGRLATRLARAATSKS